MGRSACCEKVGLKKGPWTPEEDQKLLAYIEEHGHGSWRALPSKAGLQRCGKSCRLRWTNYLRPDIKRGKFSLQEEQTIIQLHALLGNRWSAIATHLQKRTDNEIKNYWNTHLKKRLTKMGIDPVTHKPKNDALLSSDGQCKSAAKLSHMAQWESARLEAEARLARESKLRSQSFKHQSIPSSSLITVQTKLVGLTQPQFKSWTRSFSMSSDGSTNRVPGIGNSSDLESPTSTLTLSEGAHGMIHQHSKQMIESIKQEGRNDWEGIRGLDSIDLEEIKEGTGNTIPFTADFHEITMPGLEGFTGLCAATGNHHMGNETDEGFSSLLLSDGGERSLSDNGGDKDNAIGGDEGGTSSGDGGDYSYEDNKYYWNTILNFVNSSPSESPMF